MASSGDKSDLPDDDSYEVDSNPPVFPLHPLLGTMASRPPTAKELHDRINNDVSQLLQRFENMIAIATAENASHAATAVEAYQLDVEATALIRAAEDILSITRTLKELWLFGQLQTLGEDESDVKRREKLAEDVAAIKAAIDGGVLLPPSVRAMVSKSEHQSQEPSDK